MKSNFNVSLKVLQNKAYIISPVYIANLKRTPTPDDIVGIRLLYATSKRNIFDYDKVITLEEMQIESVLYIQDRFTDKKLVEVFSGLGD